MPNEITANVESSARKVTEQGTALPDKGCRYVILSNINYDKDGVVEPDTNNDNYRTSGNEIIWGYRGQPHHPLFPGETTQRLRVTNAQDIWVVTRAGKTRLIHYSLIYTEFV